MTQPSEPFGGLPPLLSEIAEVAGLSAALTLADARGGNRVYFPAPAQLSEEHPLVKIVGREAAMKICEYFAKLGGIELEVPRGPTGSRADQRRRLAQLIEEGVPSGIITRRLGISRRTVARHRARMRLADDRATDCSPLLSER
jgi:DNA-binding NarL/FixJ family response regulator